MRRLVGAIPRAFKSHKTPEGRLYGEYARAKLARFGELPRDARPMLREAGRLFVEIAQLEADYDRARARRRQTEMRRIRRQLTGSRALFVKLEGRLEAAITAQQPSDFARALAEFTGK